MIESAHLWLFFLFVFGIVIVPGMDMTVVLANALGGGRRDGLLATFGVIMTTGTVMGICVVPFVPISGTPLEDHPAPSPEFMRSILEPLGARVAAAGLRSGDIKAGCGKCGACSSLSVYES